MSAPRSRWLVGGMLCLVSLGVVASEEPAKPAEPFRYDPGTHRDPFVPLVREGRFLGSAPFSSAHSQDSKPVLQGIVWDPHGNSLALINDEELKVGDAVDGYRVAEIRRDAVVLSSDGGGSLTLSISFETPPASSTETTKGGKAK